MRSIGSARAFFRDPVGYVAANGDEDGSPIELAAPGARFLVVPPPRERSGTCSLPRAGTRTAQGRWKKRASRYVGPALNTLRGDEHRARRLLLQPALDRRRISGFSEVAEGRSRLRNGRHVAERRGARPSRPARPAVRADRVACAVRPRSGRRCSEARRRAPHGDGVDAEAHAAATRDDAVVRARRGERVRTLPSSRIATPRTGPLVAVLRSADLPPRTVQGDDRRVPARRCRRAA